MISTTAAVMGGDVPVQQNIANSYAGSEQALRMPHWLVGGVVGLCLLPLVLNFTGIRFDLTVDPDRVLSATTLDGAIQSLAGTYVHSLLEWSATILAVVAAILAFAHYRITRDVVTPIIGFALLSAGLVDAFHVLAADRLISSTADNRDFIPFTWAISRTFNAVIPISAMALIFFSRRYEEGSRPRRSIRVLFLASTVIAAIAYALIEYCATSANLPQTMFPGAVISRPWDVYPLVIYVVSGLIVYPVFGRRIKTFFSLSLWLSVVPDTATQLYMAFGSVGLFDNYFNIAHATKILAYMVPCIGLLLDYAATYRRVDRLQSEVSARAEDLQRSNADLEKFAYVASHDLKAPLRAIDNLAMFVEEDLGDLLIDEPKKNMTMMRSRVRRLDQLLDDLLQYSRAGRIEDDVTDIATWDLSQEIVDLFEVPPGISVNIDAGMPVLRTEKAPLELVLRNLIGNAIKHCDGQATQIDISACCGADSCSFSVSDDGPGIAPQHHEKIFAMFQTLQPRDQVEGSGMGLAIIKKLVESRGGVIKVVSEAGQRGSRFVFTWPVEAVIAR